MFASKLPISKICKLHCRTLKVVYDEYDKSYEDLLEIYSKPTRNQQISLNSSKSLTISSYRSL